MAHLEHGRLACQLALREGRLPVLDAETLEQAVAEDFRHRRALRAAGMHDNAGPPALACRRNRPSRARAG